MLLVPWPPVRAEDVLVHLIRVEEAEDFVPREACEILHFARARTLVESVELREESGGLRVQFVWTCGAPRRPHGRAIRLRASEWCQILYNGRYGYDDEWAYVDGVVNVAFQPSCADVFATT